MHRDLGDPRMHALEKRLVDLQHTSKNALRLAESALRREGAADRCQGACREFVVLPVRVEIDGELSPVEGLRRLRITTLMVQSSHVSEDSRCADIFLTVDLFCYPERLLQERFREVMFAQSAVE
jgi:hypothetical protein